MKTAYFDCFSGAAGDMILGALIDAGANREILLSVFKTLGLDGYDVSIEPVNRGGFAATRVDIRLHEDGPQPHRHLSDIEKIIQSSGLEKPVAERSLAVFRRLAEAEAAAHGTAIEKVHFHEVGAVDAILDIVGACWAIEHLHIERIVCSPLPLGSGTVQCAHGVIPIPAPATAHLVKGAPIAPAHDCGELLTPTGAAILTELACDFGPMPSMRVSHIGLGAGHRENENLPNVLRVFLGDAGDPAEVDRVAVLEANIDDSTPEIIAHAIDRLLDAGALDAFCLPIHMKKSRPGWLLSVIAGLDDVESLESVIFDETTTFGIRRYDADRVKLSRRVERVETPFGAIGVKIGSRGDRVVTVAAEFEDCREVAKKHNVPLRTVMAAAVDAWHRR